MFIPDASEAQMQWVDALQRMSTSVDNACRFRIQRQQEDVTDLLPRISTPALVLQALGDECVSFAEGRLLATLIPGRVVRAAGQP
jgi:hypothetical protein